MSVEAFRSTGEQVQAMFQVCLRSSHTLAWMRKIDAKLDMLGERLGRVETHLAQLRDEQLVTSSICLRLEAREVESKGLFALYQRLKAGLEGRVAALESREPV